MQHLLAGCDARQREAITTPDAPLLVVAGAGSGKTRVLTRRIAWRILSGDAVAGHVLALTFTRKAASELRARLDSLGVAGTLTAGTFHAVALRELRRRAIESGRRTPVLLDDRARLVEAVLEGAMPKSAGGERLSRREVVTALAAELAWAGAQQCPPERYAAAAAAAGRESGLDPELVASYYGAYVREKRRRGLLDFDDLLAALTAAIEEDRAIADAQRWRFRHLFVDEAQDLTAAQLRLLEAWRGGRPDVCAVGDARQSIYGWNGAQENVLADLMERWPGTTVVELQTNYRSTPQVVAVAAAALPARSPGAAIAVRPDGAVPTVTRYDDEEAEAAGVVRRIRLSRRPGRSLGDCAVLARTNAQLAVIEQALVGAGIPARRGSGTSLLSRPAVRAALATLGRHGAGDDFRRFAADLEAEARAAASRASALRCGEDDGGGEAVPAGDRAGGGAGVPAGGGAGGGAGGRAGGSGGGPASSEAEQLADDLTVLARLVAEYSDFEQGRQSADGFLAWAASSLRAEALPGSGGAVQLLTFHRAKGLEWPVVLVTGLEDGFVPIARARTRAALDEERRLLYVALTRATEELHCSWSARRSFGRRAVARQPSPFLDRLDAARRDLERATRPDPSNVAAALASARAALGRPAAPGPREP